MKSQSPTEALLSVLGSAAADERAIALAAIIEDPPADLPPGVLAAIVNCLTIESKTVRRRAADALAAIARRDSNLVAAVRAELASTEPRVRFGAAYALGAIDGESLTIDAAAALCEALDDTDGDVRWAAANLIVRLGREYPREIASRLIALARDGNPPARKMALYCVRNLGISGPEALGAALAAIRNDDTHVRLAALALVSACFSGHEGVAELVLERLDADRDPGVRRAAAVALGSLRSRADDAMAALRRAGSQTEDAALARAAQLALDRLTRS